ncbi:MAG: FeoC-like transcriptional regulator [Synergistaceae bacterium]|jgi:hypothetical protein|nr:FeoC-like transcriptional regulator [Synergistaceae bacterium]
MLGKLLDLLAEGKTLSQYDLAERLNATPQAIAASLDFLNHAGYLRKVCPAKICCGKQCAACPFVSAALENPPALWEAVRMKEGREADFHAPRPYPPLGKEKKW